MMLVVIKGAVVVGVNVEVSVCWRISCKVKCGIEICFIKREKERKKEKEKSSKEQIKNK